MEQGIFMKYYDDSIRMRPHNSMSATGPACKEPSRYTCKAANPFQSKGTFVPNQRRVPGACEFWPLTRPALSFIVASSNALGAHGYRRVVEFLQGQRDLQSAIEQTKLDVRHYAKRQLTWFRHEPGVEWLDGFGDDAAVQERALATFPT